MLVLARDAIWDPLYRNDTALMDLMSLCRQGRHRILVIPRLSKNTLVQGWLSSLTPGLARGLEQLLESGAQAASTQLAQGIPKVTLVRQGTDWKRGEVTIELAVRLLSRPLKLLLENRNTDWHFLTQMVPREQQKALLRAQADGWLEVEQGGGLSEIKKRLLNLVNPRTDQDWIERLRLWVMFDRDAHPKNRANASALSEEVRELAKSMALPWLLPCHQLNRRAIENYVPCASVHGTWASNGEKRKRAHSLSTLRKQHPMAAHQLNMKKGLLGDVSSSVRKGVLEEGRSLRDDDLDPLFRGLEPTVLALLTEGFPGLADIFLQDGALSAIEFARFVDSGEREVIGRSILGGL